MKITILPLVLLVFLTAGCVSTKNVPIAEANIQKLSGETLVMAKRDLPDFGAMTADKAMFGVIGAATVISAGNEIIKDNEVEDPSIYIAESLAAGLSETYGVKVNVDEDITVSGLSSAKVAQTEFASDYLLDVQTVNWSFTYFPTDWDNYRVIYSAKLRLIDGHSKKLIAEGFCSRVPEKDDSAPSYDELLDNHAARLKYELRLSANYCISEFKSNILKL
ncbi:hypothetical protein [Gynuella sunshinyii]|uniref:Lipoprotein n=1 Tax=Gynuella sunshinyii YC6258 TaxID=1445510 RepID=A0A0C5UYN3_9GAMM|nr:hypothetical protein [Gynuella sunshinyii]AJQ92420.1 hypothetical Protein YC6258_00370 [Gynuella sunshinyii YC6258]